MCFILHFKLFSLIFPVSSFLFELWECLQIKVEANYLFFLIFLFLLWAHMHQRCSERVLRTKICAASLEGFLWSKLNGSVCSYYIMFTWLTDKRNAAFTFHARKANTCSFSSALSICSTNTNCTCLLQKCELILFSFSPRLRKSGSGILRLDAHLSDMWCCCPLKANSRDMRWGKSSPMATFSLLKIEAYVKYKALSCRFWCHLHFFFWPCLPWRRAYSLVNF